MKKSLSIKHSQSTILRPLKRFHQDIPLRRMIKYRNQENGSAVMTPSLQRPQPHSTRHSQHAQSQVLNRFT